MLNIHIFDLLLKRRCNMVSQCFFIAYYIIYILQQKYFSICRKFHLKSKTYYFTSVPKIVGALIYNIPASDWD